MEEVWGTVLVWIPPEADTDTDLSASSLFES